MAHLVRFSPCAFQPFFVNLNAKEQPVLKDLQAIQTGTEDTTVTRQTKLDIYMQRLQNANFGTGLTKETVQQMSLAAVCWTS